MKKIVNFFINNKILIIILIIIILGFPSAMFKKAQGEQTTIVVAVGIDKKDGEFTLSVQSANSLIKASSADSSSTGEDKLEVIEDSGKTIADAMNKIEVKTGRNLGFEHCHMIVLSDSVTAQNCKSILDFFYRKANITLGAYIVCTDESASEVLRQTTQAKNTSVSSLQKTLGYNSNNYSSSSLTTLGDFFNNYYSESKTSSTIFLKTKKVAEQDQDGKINNEGDTAIFYEGTKKAVLSGELTRGLNWINLENPEGKMIVEDVSDEFLTNAVVTLKIDEGKTKKTLSVKNGTLLLSLDISIKVEVLEINQSETNIDLNLGVENYLSENLKAKISQQIQNEVSSALTYSKENNIDLCNFLSMFYAYKNKEFKKWSTSISSQQILQQAQIATTVKVFSYK